MKTLLIFLLTSTLGFSQMWFDTPMPSSSAISFTTSDWETVELEFFNQLNEYQNLGSISDNIYK